MKSLRKHIRKILSEAIESSTVKFVEWKDITNLPYSDKLKHFNHFQGDKGKEYNYTIALDNGLVVGYYAKKEGKEFYNYGYLESSEKGLGHKLISEMNKHIDFISFVRISNIPSLKAHFKSNPSKILHISEDEFQKSVYEKDLLESKIGFMSNGIYCPIYKNGLINKDLKKFLESSKDINLVHNGSIVPDKDEGKKTQGVANIKIYFLY